MTQDPNTFDQEIKDAQDGANPEDTHDQGTDTANDDSPKGGEEIDYRTKFSESSKEAQRLFRENQEKDRLIAELQAKNDPLIETRTNPEEDSDVLFPGFEELDEDARNNLVAYTENVTRRAKEEIYKDPAISFARQAYNEKRFNDAFETVVAQYPELSASKEEFKSKYFNPSNVPENIESILGDVAKIYLFDKAKDIGASEERTKADRIELERGTGGPKEPQASRTLEDWNRLAQENPAKFAKLSKEFQADMEAGRLNE